MDTVLGVISPPIARRWTAPFLTLALLLRSAMIGLAFPVAGRNLSRAARAPSASSVSLGAFPKLDELWPPLPLREWFDDRRGRMRPDGDLPPPRFPADGDADFGAPSGQWPPGTTVRDRPPTAALPVFNGVNPDYPGLRVLSSDPPVFAIDDFLSPAECDFLINAASDALQTAPVVGRGAGEVTVARTSSTCFLARQDLPEYMDKISALTGKPPGHCELPQVGRYLASQQYHEHYDAFDLDTDDGRRVAEKGGQRTATVLVYLNDVERGGETRFPALKLDVRPQRGKAVVFFPATVDGRLDRRLLHAALPAVDVKYVSQVWVRQGHHDGMPSKRLGPEFRAAAPAVWDVPRLMGGIQR